MGGQRATDQGSGRQADTWQLARLQRKLTGTAPLAEFARLIEGLPQQAESLVSWALTGEIDSLGRSYLLLQAQAVVTLECQRCLALFDLSMHVENRLQLVKTEGDLEADDVLEEAPDTPDLVLGSSHFDVQRLVEDELILALPYVPKHEVCPSLPEALETDEGGDPVRPSPFAALAKLKKD